MTERSLSSPTSNITSIFRLWVIQFTRIQLIRCQRLHVQETWYLLSAEKKITIRFHYVIIMCFLRFILNIVLHCEIRNFTHNMWWIAKRNAIRYVVELTHQWNWIKNHYIAINVRNKYSMILWWSPWVHKTITNRPNDTNNTILKRDRFVSCACANLFPH